MLWAFRFLPSRRSPLTCVPSLHPQHMGEGSVRVYCRIAAGAAALIDTDIRRLNATDERLSA